MARVVSKQFKNDAPARLKGSVVKPDYVLRLMQQVGPIAAAELIGTTPSTLYRARIADAVGAVVENAARGAWIEGGFAGGESAQATLLVDAPLAELCEAAQYLMRRGWRVRIQR